MSKKSRKMVAAPRKDGDLKVNEHSHTFTTDEMRQIRTDLLQWYDKNHRHLPWRERLAERDPNKRAYSVWVSEVMLQQTQVATVVNYYNRWMAKWPTVEDLSRASLDEVNALWSGLGYYSRAKRLHEGAKKVMDELGGVIPNNAANLLKQLPGVGRYTAGAVASIAFGEATGVVDGNVIRVLSRLRAIGAESTSNKALESFWDLSNKLVEERRPGDFNQALMEFGATLCTPQTPQCSTCPLQTHCNALKQVEKHKTMASLLLSGKKSNKLCSESAAVANDIEECNLCLPESLWEVSLGVCNYPRKSKKKRPKEETVAVCIVEKSADSGSHFLVVQRPKTGLLAGLWEFPNIVVEESKKEKSASLLNNLLRNEYGIIAEVLEGQTRVGEVLHHFSHIHHKYIIHSCNYGGEKMGNCVQVERAKRWVSREDLKDAALSTAMRKVFIAYENENQATSGQKQVKAEHSKKRKRTDAHAGKKQMVLDAFLKSNN